ncbi:MAG: NAD-dependent epimerase/dehydratase family protein [Pseudomonadota bacterium]
MTTRREFLGGSAALLGLSMTSSLQAQADEQLSFLFLGGTGFIGPHQINYALDRGHKVTMFNRGRNSGLYGDRVEELVGNRDANIDGGLKVLEGNRTWDVVIDNSGYVPRHVRDSAQLLKGRCTRYIFTSTTAVYDYDKTPSVDHTSPMYSIFPDTEEVNGDTYGPLKAECDQIVQDVFGDKATIIRPTVIVGPGDSSDRFTYWVDRFHRGGDIVCPSPRNEAAWIDARDLCHFIVSLGERDVPGIYLGTGPASVVTNRDVMMGFRAFSSAPVNLHWLTPALTEEMEFNPPWMWSGTKERHMDASASVAAGMTYRSLATSIQDTWDWWQAQPAERRANPRRWPTAEQEMAVIARLKSSA